MDQTLEDDIAACADLIEQKSNPRYILWLVWHGDNPSMKLFDFMAWINQRWDEFCQANNRPRRGHTYQDQEDFDIWLRHWVRQDISTKVRQSDEF